MHIWCVLRISFLKTEALFAKTVSFILHLFFPRRIIPCFKCTTLCNTPCISSSSLPRPLAASTVHFCPFSWTLRDICISHFAYFTIFRGRAPLMRRACISLRARAQDSSQRVCIPARDRAHFWPDLNLNFLKWNSSRRGDVPLLRTLVNPLAPSGHSARRF